MDNEHIKMKPKLSKLTTDKKRVMCAETCGWNPDPFGYYVKDPAGLSGPRFRIDELPNYPEDLNAMASAEDTLECTEAYEDALIKACKGTPIWNATAMQRLDAFLLAKGLATP